MAKRNKKQARRLRNLIMMCALCAVVLTVSTYAWFIGMKTVNVSSFDINIATTEGLYLSMDGEHWYYKLEDIKGMTAYSGNTNTWADGENEGLIPMSTVGDMDASVSRMKLFEKASLTTTPGGYRLLTSRVNNYATSGDEITQGKGYVAFDLFIKNLSGDHYYEINQPLNEEAIYLTTDSAVTVANDGIAKTGIENSVRVAFTQIGRVKADTADGTGEDEQEKKEVAVITGIKCKDEEVDGVKVTNICRNAQIWEPNDKAHVQNAINWYEKACAKRTGDDVTKDASYSITPTRTACGTVANGTAYKTYAVSRPIIINDNVDVYDGAAYNSYETNTTTYSAYTAASGADKEAMRLVDFPYFTDTMKNEKGTDRPTFMTLAPNSITKLRVYIYIEGQDIDNYDFASLGAKISVNFGFTKERITEKDFVYDGPYTGTVPTSGDEVNDDENEVVENGEGV